MSVIKNGLVSVVVPTFNRRQMLERALQSIENQSYDRIEVIVVDDGSSEDLSGALGVCRKKAVKLIRLAENSGACVARNRGIDEAAGEYVAFLDSDDEWLPSKIERQVAILSSVEGRGIGIVTCGFSVVRHSRVVKSWLPTESGSLWALALAGCRVGWGTPLVLLRRSLVELHRLRFDVRLGSRQDWDFFIQCALHAEVACVRSVEVLVNDHEGARVRSGVRALESTKICRVKYSGLLCGYEEVERKFLATSAEIAFSAGAISDAMEYLRSAMAGSQRSASIYFWVFVCWPYCRGRFWGVQRFLLELARSILFSRGTRERFKAISRC